ncbi:MAG: hypothetical protein SAJ12_06415 [Jaaginema sp. PMC 1079.18]|nr:hypothetical protein [Jaaginema sp. PMC 1079.18]
MSWIGTNPRSRFMKKLGRKSDPIGALVASPEKPSRHWLKPTPTVRLQIKI